MHRAHPNALTPADTPPRAFACLRRVSAIVLLVLWVCWAIWQAPPTQAYPGAASTMVKCADTDAPVKGGLARCGHDERALNESDHNDSEALPLAFQSRQDGASTLRFTHIAPFRDLHHSPPRKPPRHVA
jgi:hypothetical protein